MPFKHEVDRQRYLQPFKEVCRGLHREQNIK